MEQNLYSTQSFLGVKYPFYYITEKSVAVEALKKLQNKPPETLFAIDTETMAHPEYKHVPKAALSPHTSRIRLIQVFDGKSAVVFDLLKIQNDEIFIPFLEERRFVGHNSIFELKFFRSMGVRTCNIGCTRILAKLLFHATYPSDEGLSASLGDLVSKVLHEPMLKKMQLSDWTIPELTFEQIEYAALDAIGTYKLAEKLVKGIEKFKLWKIYDLCKRAQHPLAEIELNGLLLDKKRHLETINVWKMELYQAREALLKQTGLTKITGHTIADWLLENLDEETLYFWPVTETGKLKTDSHTFTDYSHLDIVKPLSAFQKKDKLTSTYGMRLLNQINSKTGRVHAHYNLCGARTGRLSSSQPNLQTVPRSPKKGSKEIDLRASFVARSGYSIICADYSQIELRVAAEVSQDEEMLRCFSEGIDIHSLTASAISRKPIHLVTDEDRTAGKPLNLGLLYGLGANKFGHYAKTAYGLDISPQKAVESVRTWRELYHGYYSWQKAQTAECKETLTCTTALGKLRRLAPDTYYGSCVNQCIQGTAAEVMLEALCLIYESLVDTKLEDEVFLINTVHDEVSIECPDAYVSDVIALTNACMEKAYINIIPNATSTNKLVKINYGKSWAEAK